MWIKKSKLTYVVTEVIIVAIGVLFAFFISNTSIKIKEHKQEKTIILDLLGDIEYNIEQSDMALKDANKYYEICNATIELLKTNTFSIDSLPYKLPALTYEIMTQIKATTYESIKSTGEFNLIKDKEIRSLIIEYYIFSLDVRRIESVFSQFSNDSKSYINKNIDVKNILNHPKEILNSKEFFNRFHSAMNYSGSRVYYYNTFLDESISIKEKLSLYYDSL